MAQAKNGDTVKVHYKGTLKDGTIFDSSEGRDPLQFKIGTGQVISGFENGVIGMEIGETKIINIPSDKAYGPHLEEYIAKVERQQLPKDLKPEIGQQLQIKLESGEVIQVILIAADENSVTLDANHPLSGHDLNFEVKLEEIA